MKRIAVVACFALATTASPVFSQESTATSNASSGSSSGSIAAVQQTYNQDGTTRMETTPNGVVGPGFSSGHPCAYAPISFGIAVIGSGLSAGGQTVDEACLLAQMGYRDAAMYMIAARSASACRALEAMGEVVCANSREAAAASSRSTAPARPASAPAPAAATAAPQGDDQIARYVSCSRNDEGQLVARVRRMGNVSDADASAYCLASGI